MEGSWQKQSINSASLVSKAGDTGVAKDYGCTGYPAGQIFGRISGPFLYPVSGRIYGFICRNFRNGCQIRHVIHPQKPICYLPEIEQLSEEAHKFSFCRVVSCGIANFLSKISRVYCVSSSAAWSDCCNESRGKGLNQNSIG